MSYSNDVLQIASDVFYAFGGEIDERHIAAIDDRVADHVSTPDDVISVLANSPSADTVEPVNHGEGFKHGLAHEAMKRDVLDEIAEFARDAAQFGD